MLTEAARLWPHHAAVAEPAGTGWRQVTFEQLESEANRLADCLMRGGVGPGKRMALLVPPGIRFVAG